MEKNEKVNQAPLRQVELKTLGRLAGAAVATVIKKPVALDGRAL